MKIKSYRIILIIATLMFSSIQYIDAQKQDTPSINTSPERKSMPDCTVSVFPNPASEILYVSLKETKCKYVIMSVVGQVVDSGVLDENKSVDVAGLKKGMYFINLMTNRTEETVRFIKN